MKKAAQYLRAAVVALSLTLLILLTVCFLRYDDGAIDAALGWAYAAAAVFVLLFLCLLAYALLLGQLGRRQREAERKGQAEELDRLRGRVAQLENRLDALKKQ